MISCCDRNFVLRLRDKKVKIPELGTYRVRGLVENLDGTMYAKIQKIKSDKIEYYELQKFNQVVRRYNKSLLKG